MKGLPHGVILEDALRRPRRVPAGAQCGSMPQPKTNRGFVMECRLAMSLLAVSLSCVSGAAQATTPAIHNDMDGDGRSDLAWETEGLEYCGGDFPTCPVIAKSVYSVAFNTWTPVVVVHNGSSPPPGYNESTRLVLAYNDPAYNGRRNVLLVRDPANGKDFAVSPYQDFKVYVLLGTADWLAVGAGDFNGDGIDDLLYRNTRDGSNKLRSSDAGWYKVVALASVGLSWNVAGIGDFDGDGHSDILWHNPATGQNSAWRSGNSTTKLAIASVPNPDWIIAGVGDFNGDHHSDILWHNTRTGQSSVWRSANSQNKDVLYTVTDLHWTVAGTGDFNGDGKWDIVWRNTATGANVYWKSANRDTRVTLPTVEPGWTLIK